MPIIVNNNKAIALPTQLYAGSVGNNIPVVAWDSIATDFNATLTTDDFGRNTYTYTWTPLSVYLERLNTIISSLPKPPATLTASHDSVEENKVTFTCISNNHNSPITYSIYNTYNRLSITGDNNGILESNGKLHISYYNEYYTQINPSINVTFSQLGDDIYEAAQDKTIYFEIPKYNGTPKFSSIVIPGNLTDRTITGTVGTMVTLSFDVIPTTDVNIQQLYKKNKNHLFRLVEYGTYDMTNYENYIDYHLSDINYNENTVDFDVLIKAKPDDDNTLHIGIALIDGTYAQSQITSDPPMNSLKNSYWNLTIQGVGDDIPIVENNSKKYYYLGPLDLTNESELYSHYTGEVSTKDDLTHIIVDDSCINIECNSYFIYPSNFGTPRLSYDGYIHEDFKPLEKYLQEINYKKTIFIPAGTGNYNISWEQ